jgi:hypothetical protein
MRTLPIAVACLALSLLTFFQFPGHTWLEEDSQIYAPILERLHDPSVFRNEILASKPHVAYTLYDETALALRAVTRLDFRVVLALEQIAARAFGIWGLYLMALALIRNRLLSAPAGPESRPPDQPGHDALALFIAAICSLGAMIVGPTVLTFEYEPTPRAFAFPLVIAAIGLMAHHRFLAAGIAGAAAFLYHPPTALPFWIFYCALALWPSRSETLRSRLWRLAPLAGSVLALAIAAHAQQGGGEAQTFFRSLTPQLEKLQRMRAPYNWISESAFWKPAMIVHHALLFAALVAAFLRVRRAIGFELRMFLLGLPVLGILSMPASWLLLERWHWALVPQYQPMRLLIYITLFVQFLAAAASVAAARRRPFESVAWFALVYLPVLQPGVVADSVSFRSAAVTLGLAAVAWLAVWLSGAPSRPATTWLGVGWQPASLILGLAAFLAIPAFGGVARKTETPDPDLDHLAVWARGSTPKDAVFLFPDAAKQRYPGVFRAEALRAVYVDWKGGGQVNYLAGFADQWWFRWQQTMASRFKPRDVPKYGALGIQYIVLQPKNRLPGRQPLFESPKYVAYAIAGPTGR